MYVPVIYSRQSRRGPGRAEPVHWQHWLAHWHRQARRPPRGCCTPHQKARRFLLSAIQKYQVKQREARSLDTIFEDSPSCRSSNAKSARFWSLNSQVSDQATRSAITWQDKYLRPAWVEEFTSSRSSNAKRARFWLLNSQVSDQAARSTIAWQDSWS